MPAWMGGAPANGGLTGSVDPRLVAEAAAKAQRDADEWS